MARILTTLIVVTLGYLAIGWLFGRDGAGSASPMPRDNRGTGTAGAVMEAAHVALGNLDWPLDLYHSTWRYDGPLCDWIRVRCVRNIHWDEEKRCRYLSEESQASMKAEAAFMEELRTKSPSLAGSVSLKRPEEHFPRAGDYDWYRAHCSG